MPDFELLFEPVEQVDVWLTGLFDGASVWVALVIALVLGLRHASDPDHLVAVTSLIAADDRGARGAARLGAWWGVGHAATLVLVGMPLIGFKSELPGWLESGAEKAVGVVIVGLAARVVVKWIRGDFRPAADRPRGKPVRSPRQAAAIGVLHGLAGSGAVALLLIAALPTQLEAAAALAIFAPMSAASMALCSGAFAWVLTRRVVEPVYRTVVIPAFSAFGGLFGLWYAGLF
jgi:hypothetical protein